mgnify:CR=1 FL=1
MIEPWHVGLALAVFGCLIITGGAFVWVRFLNPLFKFFDWFVDRWRGYGG